MLVLVLSRQGPAQKWWMFCGPLCYVSSQGGLDMGGQHSQSRDAQLLCAGVGLGWQATDPLRKSRRGGKEWQIIC